MRVIILGLLLLLASHVDAMDLRVEWLPVDTNTEGQTIDIDGYNIYYTVDGAQPVTDHVSDTSYTMPSITPGLYVFQVTAIKGGMESGRSAPVAAYIPVISDTPISTPDNVKLTCNGGPC